MAIETEVHVGLDVPEARAPACHSAKGSVGAFWEVWVPVAQIIGVKQILEYFVRQYAEVASAIPREHPRAFR
eukprot:3939970-Amphidinium_carterae.1